MEITPGAGAPLSTPPEQRSLDETAARQAAEAFEANFLAEMLKSAGLGKSPEGFGGGEGEDQFGSFLVDEQAKQMVKAGGIGLAESLVKAMMERAGE